MTVDAPGGSRPSDETAALVQLATYYHNDALGSPVAETNGSGQVTKYSRYEPYGAPADGVYTNGPGYTGHMTDSFAKLSYMQQRYYDPMLGRFMSKDPVITDRNTGANYNRYAYAGGNPYRFFDPDGRQLESLFAIREGESGAGEEAAKMAAKSISNSLPSNEQIASAQQRLGSAIDTTAGAVLNHTEVSATGKAAFGLGGVAQKGIYNSDDKVSITTGVAFEAKLDAKFKFSIPLVENPIDSPIDMSGEASFHFLGGATVGWSYDPGGSIEISVGGGVGLGAGFTQTQVDLTVSDPKK